MDFFKDGIIYVLMILPTMLAVTVVAQGAQRVKNHHPEGKAGIGFGIFFLVLIAVSYFLFIR